MGRPRKTIEELKRSGNYRPSRHKERLAEGQAEGQADRVSGKASEAASSSGTHSTHGPKVAIVPPEKPESLAPSASQIWDELISLLGGSATERDGPLLRMACEWWAELRLVREQMRASEVGDKVYMQSLRAAALCSKELDRILSRFPLTPKDRANFGVVSTGPPVAKVPVKSKSPV